MRWRDVGAALGALAGRAWSDRRIAVVSIAWTWGVYLALIEARLRLISFPREAALLERHCLTAASGAALTWGLYLVLRRLGHLPIALRVGTAVLMVLPVAVALTLINYAVLYAVAPDRIWSARVVSGTTLNGVVARTLPEMYFVLASWAALYGSVSSALESRDAQRRAALSQAETQEARLKALRYQLNPHFLFNALNSVSALVMRDDKDAAERVIEALSKFLRSTLEDEVGEDATLAQEVEQQRLYLDIEQVRFENRLRVAWVVPDGLGQARLPPLILQPIVENVLSHAVSLVDEPVTMTIAAFADGESLRIAVEDDGRGQGSRPGTGVGLRNVASRLEVRYGAAAWCRHGPRPEGGYRVELMLPLLVGAAGA